MIHIDKVTRRFGKLEAVRNLSLEIGEGEIFGLVGPDGAGKTTTLRMLVGLMDPTEGTVSVAGLDVGKHLDAVKDQIGYMAQKFGLYGDLTVEENMFFYSDLFGIDHAERDRMMAEFLDMTRMTPFRQRPAAKLSGGMKQKLALMCTLLHRPRVLFLDEPTNGVDPLSRRDFWEILYRLAGEGMTILVSTAYLDEAERCSRVGLMHKGRLIRCDAPATLRQQLAPRCFRAESSDLRAARGRLNDTPGVLGAVPSGAALHVYLEDGAFAAEVERAAGDVRLTPLDPALEDVFIALIRQEERHAAA
ncbi:ABC transporter ATP-binding protein [uncultured Paludibaculum sp.]|uniref:ABC transporter ATP-binding protein n=1 Tax=uncultured Paludibaculum sp. TaxID=1765020 RepID=UPI002AAA860F|nr:ABC transporter ATP-binding protein [uncultured Paludibaculum sp.]